MKTKPVMEKLSQATLSLLVFLSFSISGCTAIGTVVPQENRISMTEDTQNTEDTFKQGSLTIVYNYSLAGTTMTLIGRAFYLGGADMLDIRVAFFNTHGVVTAQKLVYATNYRATHGLKRDRNFEKTIAVPAGAAGFTFIFSSLSRSGHR